MIHMWRQIRNDQYRVTGIQADVCSACGERYYDLDAMQAIEDASQESRTPTRS